MSSLQQIVEDNIQALKTAQQAMLLLTPQQYTQVIEPYFTASAGSHFRHIFDHYLRFFAGLEKGVVDYDGRQRDPAIETDIELGLTKLKEIISELDSLVSNQRRNADLSVKICTSTRPVPELSVASTVERELVFLHGHTIHHYALVALILKHMEVPLPESFGIAPSTLKYQQAMQCAQ